MTALDSDRDLFYVGGRWVSPSGSESYDVVSPATESVVARVTLPSLAEADAAIAAARRAFDGSTWPRLSMAERAGVVERFCEAYELRKADFDAAWMAESGPTAAHAALISQFVPVMWRDTIAHARRMSTDELRQVLDGTVRVLREPAGVAVVITTWNGPGLYLAMKVVPALLAGCTVIMKPAVESQLTSRIIGEMADAAGIPEGVLSVLPAATDVSAYLVSHRDVDKVSITGSIAAGRSVMAACASNITGVTLELGGKSPAIIVGDVPVDRVVASVVPGFIPFQAQVCVALTRVLVPRARQDEFVDAIAAVLSKMTVGAPDDPASDLGPLGTRRQYERVMGYIGGAVQQGARLALGGKRPEGLDVGYYVAPTIFADVTPEMTIAQQEVFGPVLSVMPYDSIEEAIEIANGTEYGLSAAVYAEDDETALDVAVRLECGTVAVNTAGVSFFAPFGGYKNSGLGRENGAEGIEEYLRYKAIKVS